MKKILFILFGLIVSLPAYCQTELSEQPRIKQVTKDYYVNLDYYDKYPSYERLVDRSNHLHGWSKFCRIYGCISAGIGGFALGTGIAEGDGYCITMGAISAVEGIIVGSVGDSLRKKCNKTREEIMRINSVGFPTSEIKIKDKK